MVLVLACAQSLPIFNRCISRLLPARASSCTAAPTAVDLAAAEDAARAKGLPGRELRGEGGRDVVARLQELCDNGGGGAPPMVVSMQVVFDESRSRHVMHNGKQFVVVLQPEDDVDTVAEEP